MKRYALMMIAVAALSGCASQAQTQTYRGDGFSVVAVPTDAGTTCAVVEHTPTDEGASADGASVAEAAIQQAELQDMKRRHSELQSCTWSS